MPGENRENIIDEFIALHLQGKTEDQISSVLGISKTDCQEMGRIVRAILTSSKEAQGSSEHLKNILSSLPVTQEQTIRNTNKNTANFLEDFASAFQSLSWQYKLAPVFALFLVMAGLWILNIPQNLPSKNPISEVALNKTEQTDQPIAKMIANTPQDTGMTAQDSASGSGLARSAAPMLESAPQPMLMTAIAPSTYSDSETAEIDALIDSLYQEDEITQEETAYVDNLVAQDQSLNQYEEIII